MVCSETLTSIVMVPEQVIQNDIKVPLIIRFF